MKSPKSSGKPKKRKLIVVRRVNGRSMMPYLNPGQIVVGHGLFRRIQPNDIIMFEHNGVEKIKRVHQVFAAELFVLGDNSRESTDSRQFGMVPIAAVKARIIS